MEQVSSSEALVDPHREKAISLLDAFHQDLLDKYTKLQQSSFRPVDIFLLSSTSTILNAQPELQRAVLLASLLEKFDLGKDAYKARIARSDLGHRLLQRRLPLSSDDFATIISAALQRNDDTIWSSLLARLEGYLSENPLTDSLNLALLDLKSFLSARQFSIDRGEDHAKRLRRLLSDGSFRGLLDINELWALRAVRELEALPEKKQSEWKKLLKHTIQLTSTKPSNKWLSQAKVLSDQIGEADFVETISRWLTLIEKRKDPTFPTITTKDGIELDPELILPENAEVLKGLVWMSTNYENEELSCTISDAAEFSLEKVKNFGPRCTKVANACIHALSEAGNKSAIAALGRLKAR
ncbi:MAG: hypothetical protein K2X81_20520, partial [Candidatus Obscuribacterales bacterium]|nr:hypothetical protein [Candidatus Obscuribacterales bacterium]